ncbi:MAG: hemolysin family protein [Elusimicrobia bacterium]|nr:hemolysin family protein [Elusimicrobiota bacterium]
MIFIIIKFIILFLLICFSAFFAGTETALTSLSSISLRQLKERFAGLREQFEFWERRPNDIISTLLAGNNLVSIGASVLATSLSLDFIDILGFQREIILVVFPVSITLVILFFGEIIPKISARYMPGKVAIWGMPLIFIINKGFKPVNRFLLSISENILGIFGQKVLNEDTFLKPEELKFLLSSKDILPLPDSARHMIKNILDFGKTRISQVMVPKSEIQAVDLNQDKDKIIEQIIDKEYSRIPVYRGNIDNIAGIIYSRDLALAWRNGSLFLIEDLIRPATFVPETAYIDRVLKDFKTSHNHMALVVDEFGSTVGLVTIEDIVEEVVGEIWDEYDIQEKRIISLPDGFHLIKGVESLMYVNSELKLNLPAGDFSTINGWVLDLFGKIPKQGDTIRWDNLLIEIVDADKKKVLRIRLKKLI